MAGPVSAHDVARELELLLPDLGDVQKHMLLYLCQGMFLALYGQPLFNERIAAWDMGPVVVGLWRDEQRQLTSRPQTLDDAQRSTVHLVVSRYGRLSRQELVDITHGHEPWRDAYARPRGPQQVMVNEAIADFFRAAEDQRRRETGRIVPDPDELAAWLESHPVPAQPEPDDMDAMWAFFGCGPGPT